MEDKKYDPMNPHLSYKPDAMTGLATGKKKKRPQEILTPKCVVEFLEDLWGTIMLDPCATRDKRSVVNAEFRRYEEDNGLEYEWTDGTYVNPPYSDLQIWMMKTCEQAQRGIRIAMLCPTRGHRVWWHAARESASVHVELKPLSFIGYNGSYPAPLSILMWNEPQNYEIKNSMRKAGLGFAKVHYLTPKVFDVTND